MKTQVNERLKERILDLCKGIAGSRQITAVCLYGPWVCGYADEKTDVNVLMVLERFDLRVNTYFEIIYGANISILIVNRLDFERDVKRGLLGEFFSEKVTAPYEPLKNRNYLWLKELKTKKRMILELLENLILEFPESSQEFLIREEYFMYEIMMMRARLFPLLTYRYLNMLRRKLKRKNVEAIKNGYLEALEILKKERVIFYSNSYIKITQNHIASIKKRKSRLPLFLKSIQRIALPHLLSVYSKTASSLFQEQRIYMNNHRKVIANGLVSRLENPKKYVFLPTPLGPVPLSDKSEIENIARKILPGCKLSEIQVKNIGGVLNDVYSVILRENSEEQKFVVKRFRDWSNLKWLSLTLWSFGTKSFSVLGQSRLEKEYAINKLLQKKGFAVPQIFYISHRKRLIFEEFIEGEKLVKTIKRIISANNTKEDIALVMEIGKMIAKIHSLGVSLGDCKPENFIVTNDKIVLLDLEQATRDGDQAWDIAEFLYYSGHYCSPISSTNAARIMAINFLKGYLEVGGKKKVVKKAGSAKYTKVFSVFTSPHVLFAISSICQKMGKE